MGKASRARRKAKRSLEKKAAKQQKKLLYASYAKAGENSKGSRTARKIRAQKQVSIRLSGHSSAQCGNVGCKRCFGVVAAKTLLTAQAFKGIYR
jgi:hypothetical protein